jgi:hypothetical protein
MSTPEDGVDVLVEHDMLLALLLLGVLLKEVVGTVLEQFVDVLLLHFVVVIHDGAL